MSSYQRKSDWGCLAWFMLAFAILAAVLCVIMLASAPSGGGGSPCQSLSNNDRLGKGNSTGPVKWSDTSGGVTYVSFPVGATARSSSKPAPSSSPIKPGPALKPVMTGKGQTETQKPPRGGSGGSHKPHKVDIDLGDCD